MKRVDLEKGSCRPSLSWLTKPSFTSLTLGLGARYKQADEQQRFLGHQSRDKTGFHLMRRVVVSFPEMR